MEWFQNVCQDFYNATIREDRYLAYLEGLKVTIQISFFAVLVGIVIGIIIATIRVSAKQTKSKILAVLSKICGAYVTVFRGTPVMVQLMIIYFWIFNTRGANQILIGTVCFGLNSGAYIAEIMRGGIESIDKGQTEAGRSLGFNGLQTMRYIILPQAIKNVLPALGNEFIALIKETSVISTIAVNDLMKMASFVTSRTYNPLPPYIIAAVIYFVIVVLLTKLLGIFERRLAKSDHY